MVKIKDLIFQGADKLKDVADNPRSEARILLAHTLKVSISDVILYMDKQVDEDKEKLFESCVLMRAQHKPIAYITGEKEFFGLSFKVNEHTLIPRPETEMIVEEILSSGKDKLLDLCTGSGCIPIAAAKNATIHAHGVDISEGAISIAQENAIKHGLDGKVSFEVCDILNKDFFGSFDILTSNPPYITDADMLTLPPDVADFEPRSALAGGSDGLSFYRWISKIAPKNLKGGGMLIFEIGIGQGDAVANMMENNFTDIKIKKDLAGIDRIVTGILKRRN
ncbi:MAG: peptide chain release factor N(5)-glutamine methyltransferase [Clostridia bacterium]|nr:peptide chain release factor N(5)-glutamine methyltransferase [Clostridia bacterium]